MSDSPPAALMIRATVTGVTASSDSEPGRPPASCGRRGAAAPGHIPGLRLAVTVTLAGPGPGRARGTVRRLQAAGPGPGHRDHTVVGGHGPGTAGPATANRGTIIFYYSISQYFIHIICYYFILFLYYAHYFSCSFQAIIMFLLFFQK
jgi:hypothetical protein